MLQGISANDQLFLDALNVAETRQSQAETQISSGLKLNTPSDDPDAIGPSLALRAQLAQTQQVETNLGQFTSEADTAEQAISNAVQVLQQANVLATQGATETETPAQRQALAAQVQGLLGQMVATANTQSNGRYLFSGDTDQVAPFSIDGAGNVGGYYGSASTRQAIDSDGSNFLIARSGQEIFQAQGGSALGALSNLMNALNDAPSVPQSDPDYNQQYEDQTQAITNALGEVQQASDQVNQQLAFYGTVQQNLTNATNNAQNLDVNLQTQLSSLDDADVTTDAIELTESNTQIDAALSARAKLPTTTLFDYLG
jgi:flagellar hook-associated protein 3 FlgL